jgi:glyoxylase-like metal-dependent hydrolase (beta-lactamase superfamily II)
VLFDSGPASTIDALRSAVEAAGYEMSSLRAVLLTHIHLDHGAAAGSLVKATGCAVWAHPRGIHHLRNPEDKLMPSARRLYGDRLEPLFGVMEAIPEAHLHPVVHGEPVRIGGLEAVGWHTPGHASHHVAWQTGAAVAMGDVAGIRLPGSDYVVPPMPPPDIDVPAWRQSIDLVRSLQPERLLLSHFGSWNDPELHLDQLDERLSRWVDATRRVVAAGGGVDELAARLAEVNDHDMERASVPEELRRAYRTINPMAEAAAGLFRYATQNPEPAG